MTTQSEPTTPGQARPPPDQTTCPYCSQNFVFSGYLYMRVVTCDASPEGLAAQERMPPRLLESITRGTSTFNGHSLRSSAPSEQP